MPIERGEQKIITQIRNALAMAEASSSENEREIALARANRLMTKHAIDEAMLDAQRTVGEKRIPTSVFFDVFEEGWEWSSQFRTILSNIGSLNRCRIALRHGKTAVIFGMQEDVEWVQLLWLQVFMEFVTKIEPKWDTTKPLGVNVLRMKEAGYQWKDIWDRAYKALGEVPSGTKEYDPKADRWMMNEYKKTLKVLGRDPVATQRNAAYRASFVEGFTARVSARLEKMREDNKRQTETDGRYLPALRGVEEAVNEAFYGAYPFMRPETPEEAATRRRLNQEREQELERKDREFLASLSGPELKKVLDERERKKREDAKESARYWRDYDSKRQRLNDDAGAAAGRRAGDSVNLNRSSKVDYEDRKPLN